MASYPVLDVTDLAEFSGQAVSWYTNTGFVTTALRQSELLFKIGTCLVNFPDNQIHADLAQEAILAMAQAIYSVQPFQKVLANPFSSETIGSYSYSKVAGAIANALPTGVTWFDMAVSMLGVCDLDIPAGGGIEVFEYDAEFAKGRRGDNVRVLSPQDLDYLKSWGVDPAPGQIGAPPTIVQDGDSDGGFF